MTYIGESHRYTGQERSIFKYAKDEGNEVLATSLSLDQQVQQLQGHGNRLATLPDFTQTIDQTKEQLRDILDRNEYSGIGTWNDYYRLLGHYELLDEIVYTPIVFRHGTQPDLQSTRELLVDGVYGLCVTIIESALDQYDHADTTNEEKEQLVGVLNEYTAPALLNYEQSPDRIALPAPANRDMTAKTDVVLYTLTQDGYNQLDIQVKSSHPRSKSELKASRPKRGILITGRQMGNSPQNNYATARALVDEIHGNADSQQIAHLDLFKQHFNDTVKQRGQSKVRPSQQIAA
jgi:hypothetical protein